MYETCHVYAHATASLSSQQCPLQGDLVVFRGTVALTVHHAEDMLRNNIAVGCPGSIACMINLG